jgi:hypothetical protein
MTHDQVRQLVRRINPIPDPGTLESVDAPVLDTRQERRIDMQVDERPLAEERRDNRWRGPLVGIAAAAVVLVGGLIFIAPDQDDVATPAPNAFGRDGYHLVLQVPDGCNSEAESIWIGGLWGERNYQVEGQIVEYWFLDVEGTTVMVEATRPVESTEEIVTELNAELDTVLDTLVITP